MVKCPICKKKGKITGHPHLWECGTCEKAIAHVPKNCKCRICNPEMNTHTRLLEIYNRPLNLKERLIRAAHEDVSVEGNMEKTIFQRLNEIEQECPYCEKKFICFDREAFNKIRDKYGE